MFPITINLSDEKTIHCFKFQLTGFTKIDQMLKNSTPTTHGTLNLTYIEHATFEIMTYALEMSCKHFYYERKTEKDQFDDFFAMSQKRGGKVLTEIRLLMDVLGHTNFIKQHDAFAHHMMKNDVTCLKRYFSIVKV